MIGYGAVVLAVGFVSFGVSASRVWRGGQKDAFWIKNVIVSAVVCVVGVVLLMVGLMD